MSRTPNPVRQSPRPHYAQARQWYRYARILRHLPPEAKPVYARKEEALAWSLEHRTRGLVFASVLEVTSEHDRGLFLLERRLRGFMTEREAWPELEARLLYDEEADVEGVELLLHESTGPLQAVGPTRVPVGTLGPDDANWIKPLLREHLPLRVHVVSVSSPWRRVCPSERLRVTVAIGGASEAARAWLDAYEDRKARMKERYADTLEREGRMPVYVQGPHEAPRTGSRLMLASSATLEDWVREEVWARAEEGFAAARPLFADELWRHQHAALSARYDVEEGYYETHEALYGAAEN